MKDLRGDFILRMLKPVNQLTLTPETIELCSCPMHIIPSKAKRISSAVRLVGTFVAVKICFSCFFPKDKMAVPQNPSKCEGGTGDEIETVACSQWKKRTVRGMTMDKARIPFVCTSVTS